MKRQRAEISSNVISHIRSAHPIEMWRSNKLGIKEKISRGNFPRLIFSCPVPSGLPHRSHCVPMNMNPCGFKVFLWSCWADSNCRPHPYQDWLVVVPLCSSPVFCCNFLSVFNALTIFRQISTVICCSLLSAEKVLNSRFFSRFFKSLLFCVG